MDILNQIEDPKMKKDLEKITNFHGYLSSGALIGYQMLKIAKKELDIKEGEKIFITSETQNCLPDPFQILLGSTTGNKRLNVLDYEKMAVTINKAASPEQSPVNGIRIYLDPAKTKKYPVLHAWFMNERKVPHEEVLPELIKAENNIYSYDFVEVEVGPKKSKNVIICSECGESFVQKCEEELCIPCFSKKKDRIK